MKIGIDGRAAKWYRGTGIGTYTYQLINNLSIVDSSNQYLILLPQNTDLVLKDNFTIECLKESSNNHFWDDVKTPNLLKNNKMDLYHVPQNGVGLSENINCLKAITLHDIIPLRMPQTVSDRYLRIFNEEMPKILDNCDGIITVSEFSKLDIAEEFNFPKEKIFVTHLAAEDIYRPIDRAYCKKFIKDNYKIADNFILYVGGYSPRKNIIGILEAFSLLKDNLKEGRYVGTLIVKELCMRRLEGAEKSRKYLYELLDSDILNQFPSFSHYVYHSLGWNYLESQKYEKALEALQKALPLRPKQLDKAITTLLIGRIYFEIGQYEEAQKYYSETKETILMSESLRTKLLWIDEQLDLYCKLNQIHQVKELFIELKSLVDIDKFPESMLYELKTSMYKRFEGLSPLRREEYLFLYNFFTS